MGTRDEAMTHLESFGWMLFHRREKLGLSLEQLADKLSKEPEVQAAYPRGLRRQSVHTWESGRSYPPRSIDAALCRVMKLKPKDLVIGVE